MRFLSARQAISDAYNTKLTTQWEFEPECGDVPLRRYCPACHRAPIRYIGERQQQDHNGEPLYRNGQPVVKHTWRCGGCKADTARPLVRKPVGVPQRSSNAGRRDNDWRICSALEAGKVWAVVDALPAPERAWVLYAYTDQANVAGLESVIMDWLVDQLDAAPPVNLDGLGSMRMALHVLLLLVHDARSLFCTGLSVYSDAQLAARVGVNRSQFCKSRHWGKFAEAARQHLDALNARALGPVAELVTDMRRRADEAA